MKALITDPKHSLELAAWAARRIPHVGEAGFGPCWAIGVAVDARLSAVVVYHDWQPGPGTLQLSMAADDARWIGRETVGRILGLAFASPWASAPVNKVWVAIPHTAPRVVKLNKRLGLRWEASLRYHFGSRPKVNAEILGIMRHEWARIYGEGK